MKWEQFNEATIGYFTEKSKKRVFENFEKLFTDSYLRESAIYELANIFMLLDHYENGTITSKETKQEILRHTVEIIEGL